MIVKLTNSYKGNPTEQIAINSDHVVSVFETLNQDNVTLTAIYTVNSQTFTVEEPFDQVYAMLRGEDYTPVAKPKSKKTTVSSNTISIV